MSITPFSSSEDLSSQSFIRTNHVAADTISDSNDSAKKTGEDITKISEEKQLPTSARKKRRSLLELI